MGGEWEAFGRMGHMKTVLILTSCGVPASPRASALSKGRRAEFQTLTFLGCRLEPRSPTDKQLPVNPILKALLGSC